MLKDNLTEYFERSIRTNWDHPAFSNYKGETVTFRDVAEHIHRLHAIFNAGGIRKGDKIALIGKNSINWAVTYLATISYGAVIVPVLPDFHSDDMHHVVNHSDSVLLFVAEDINDKLDESQMPNLKAIFSLTDMKPIHDPSGVFTPLVRKVHDDFAATEYVTREKFALTRIANEELAAIVYTSGTTGFSKGVMLQHNSLIANVRYAMNNFQLKAGERMVSFLPLAHAFGCAFDFLFPFASGAHVVFLSKIPSPNVVLQAFQEYRPRIVCTVPLVLEKIYRNRIRPTLDKKTISLLLKVPFIGNGINSSIRKKLVDAFGGAFWEVVVGGAALSTEVQQFFTKIGFPFTVGYGMTECGPLISYSHYHDYRMFAVGRVVDTLEIKIDSVDQERVVGEILVRGENLMVGYYKNEQDTRATIDKDGWLHTGDLGLIDKEGFIYIKGRSKTMYLGPSGENIYPEQVESKINSLALVSESLLIERGGKLVALVYPDMEAVDREGLDEKALAERMEENRKAINQLMPAYINISKIELYPEEFEKTPTKKIKRFLYTVSEAPH